MLLVKVKISISGESFYHVLETVESSLVEPEDESFGKAVDDRDTSDRSSIHGLCLYNIYCI